MNLIEHFDENGMLSYRYFVDNQGVMQGKCVRNWSNGTIYTMCFYKNGELDGPFDYYNSKGEKVNSITFVSNKRITPFPLRLNSIIKRI
jgi:antitoxin component YwqK of YwqJK toxin-antitoxin module